MPEYRNILSKHFWVIAFVLSILFGGMGCRERAHFMKPFGWEMTGGRSDSLLRLLDSCVYSYGDPDTLTRLAEEFCALSLEEDPNGVYAHRRLYWEGTARFMSGDFEGGDSLRRQAISVCDTVRFPRDYALYRMACEQTYDFPDNLSRYVRYTEDLKLFLECSDNVSAFSRAVMLADLMSTATLHSRARDYMLMADSLLGDAGLTELQLANKVNVASCMFAAGDTLGAVELLRAISADPAMSDPTVRAIIDLNTNQMTGDTAAIDRAWACVKDNEALERMRPLVAAALVRTRATGLSSDSLSSLRRELGLSRLYAYTPADELLIASAMALASASTESREGYVEALREYMACADAYYSELTRNEVAGAEMNVRISEVERKAEYERMRRMRHMWIALTLLAVLAGAVGLLTMRYVNRLKRIRLLDQLEHEKLRRDNIAAGMMIAEKELLTRQLQERIDALVAANAIGPESARDIALALSPEAVEADSTDEAEFMRRFIEKFPGVGRTGRRLALYIRQRKDTWEIAQAMNIRKESVLQARWRLRINMGLPPEEDLDTVILSI